VWAEKASPARGGGAGSGDQPVNGGGVGFGFGGLGFGGLAGGFLGGFGLGAGLLLVTLASATASAVGGSSRAAEGVLAGSAKLQDESSSRLLTVVARVCPTYHDVMANLARNDIQESLQDLGMDTVYSSGQPIDPAIEAREQPNCTPLPDWTFTLGTGYQSRAVSGTWGSLSIVTGAFSTSLVTKEKTSLLNDQGQDTGDQIEGAATIELTPEQADIAARPDSLWIQGGTTTDPVLDKTYPGQYGSGRTESSRATTACPRGLSGYRRH
jgi:hypothetical protein